MPATDMLRDLCRADWDAATDHVFCRELADGSLLPEKMKWYLAQDYQFIDRFVRLLASAIAQAPSLADAVPGAQFLALVTGPENTYFQRSFEALGMSDAERNAPPAPQTSAFQDVMAEAQNSGRYERMLAVLVVAEWCYLAWADRYTAYSADLPFWYAEWIDLHSGPGFEGVVQYLKDQLDAGWEGLDPADKAAATDLFRRAVACERAFFDAAYAAEPVPA